MRVFIPLRHTARCTLTPGVRGPPAFCLPPPRRTGDPNISDLRRGASGSAGEKGLESNNAGFVAFSVLFLFLFRNALAG